MDFPVTINGQVYDLAVTCDRGVFCRLEDWPQTLPGQLAAHARRIAELEAEVARLQAAQGQNAGARLAETLQRERRPCPGCGLTLGKNNWGRHVARCTGQPAPPWPGLPAPLAEGAPPATAALAATIRRPAEPAREGPAPKAGAPS